MSTQSRKVNRARRCLMIAVVFVFASLIISACQSSPPSKTQTPATAATAIPFQVTSIDLTVQPPSIEGMKCGTKLVLTYTATFHIPANTVGGTVQFAYTVDGGKTHQDGLVEFHARGETSRQYQFTSSGALEPHGTFPGGAQVTTLSPVHLTSQLLYPEGSCTS